MPIFIKQFVPSQMFSHAETFAYPLHLASPSSHQTLQPFFAPQTGPIPYVRRIPPTLSASCRRVSLRILPSLTSPLSQPYMRRSTWTRCMSLLDG